MEFGLACRKDNYLFEDGTAMCNHGSYGAVPHKVLEKQRSLQLEVERTPDRWFRETTPRLYEEALCALAEFLGSDKNNLMFIQNPTTAVNSVLKSFPFQPGDAVLVTTLTYGAVRFTAEVIHSYAPGAECVGLEIDFPIKDVDYILQLYKDVLNKHPNIKLAVIDTITSPTAVAMPVSELVILCHQMGVQVMLDGAHSPGQQELRLDTLGADYFTGTLHKWLFAPRGCAFLWVHPTHHATVHPVVTSWFYQKDIQHQFHKQGTRDDTPYFCLTEALNFHHELGGLGTRDDSAYFCTPDAIKFHQSFGGIERIVEYCTQLRKDAVKLLMDGWKTETLEIPEPLQAPYMECIKVPSPKVPGAQARYTPTPGGAINLQYDTYQVHKLQCAVVVLEGALWVRISAFVYNTTEDYVRLRDAILDLMNREDFPEFTGCYWPYRLENETK